MPKKVFLVIANGVLCGGGPVAVKSTRRAAQLFIEREDQQFQDLPCHFGHYVRAMVIDDPDPYETMKREALRENRKRKLGGSER